MARAGILLLAASVVLVPFISVAGTLLLFPSWALAAAGLTLLARDERVRRPARVALAAFALVVLLSLVGAGVTLGRAGGVLLATPTLDPSTVLVSFGIVASFWAAGVFVLAWERARGEKLALVGLALVLVGLVVFVGEELARADVLARPWLSVSGPGLAYLLVGGGLVLLAAFARASLRIARAASPT